MNNKKILRTALPFIVIFIISVLIAAYTYVQKNLTGARAGDEALKVTLTNVRDPLSTNETWEWKMIGQTDRAPSSPIVLTYTARWCLKQGINTPCIQGMQDDYFYEVGTGNVTINAKETAAKITHQSVNCGRIELDVLRDGQSVGKIVHSTSTECTDNLRSGGASRIDSASEISDLINKTLKSILSLTDGDEEEVDENPEDPSEPGEPGGGGSGDLCKTTGQLCSEPYRESCGQGDQAGTRVCHKHGVCAAPGSGVQCSWGAGSFCEPCEPGTTIGDPVPPIKPPQDVPPGNPGGGNSPQPPAPLPPVSNSDAQEVVDLVDYIRASCKFPNYDYGQVVENGLVSNYNAAQCMTGFKNSQNDKQTKDEIVASATNYERLQCVGFTEAAVAAASGNSYNGPGGHAYQRATSNDAYLLIDFRSQPAAPNDIAVWNKAPGMPWGHVAYIVESNSSAFTVMEANFLEVFPDGTRHPCWGCVRKKTYQIGQERNERNFAGWLRKR